MSMAVQLDMEVLQRIKFLMEYDVMKTSSENILLEQIKLTYNQELAKIAGYKNITPKQADELAAAGRLVWVAQQQAAQQQAAQQQAIRQQNAANLKTMMSTDPESALRKAAILDPYRDKKERYGTIDLPRTHVNRMYSQPSKEVKEMRLDELTQKVRDIMTDWKTMTVETFLTITGVGIPVVIGVNGLWFTLEAAQVLKGTPDWLNLVFSFIATTTSGLGSAELRPLYQAVGKSMKGGGKDFVYLLELLYFHAKELGLWNKLKPILQKISKMSSTFSDLAGKTWKWLKDNVLWIFDGVIWAGKVTINGLKTLISGIFNTMDTWLATIGTKAGVNPEVAQKLGSAARWGSLPYVVHKGSELLSKPDFSKEDMEKIKSMTDSGWVYPPPK
jgi:hypothetical protein